MDGEKNTQIMNFIRKRFINGMLKLLRFGFKQKLMNYKLNDVLTKVQSEKNIFHSMMELKSEIFYLSTFRFYIFGSIFESHNSQKCIFSILSEITLF